MYANPVDVYSISAGLIRDDENVKCWENIMYLKLQIFGSSISIVSVLNEPKKINYVRIWNFNSGSFDMIGCTQCGKFRSYIELKAFEKICNAIYHVDQDKYIRFKI